MTANHAANAVLCALAILLTTAAQASQDDSSPVTPPIAAPAPRTARLTADTPVAFTIADTISSKTGRTGAPFAIRLTDAIAVDGVVVVPADTRGVGEIVHAARARALGKAGELILAARYLDCGDLRIDLRGFRLNAAGKPLGGLIVAGVAAVGLFAAPMMLISGGETVVPAGTAGTARLRSAVDVPPTPACIAAAADAAIAAGADGPDMSSTRRE